MPTRGQSFSLHQNINAYIGLAFVASFALLMGLTVWHAAFGHNPLADFLSQTALANSTGQ